MEKYIWNARVSVSILVVITNRVFKIKQNLNIGAIYKKKTIRIFIAYNSKIFD